MLFIKYTYTIHKAQIQKPQNTADERWRLISDSASSLFLDTLKPLVVIVTILVLVMLVSEVLLGQFSSLRLIGTKGDFQSSPSIGIYQDCNGTNSISYIDWGSVDLGLTRNVTIYIRNEGKNKVGLSLNTTDWKPANVSNYMNLSWSYNGAALFPNEIIQVTLTLSQSSSRDFINFIVTYDVEEFSFNITIYAIS